MKKLHKKYIVKKSPHGGLGLFALEKFKRGDKIIEYQGHKITNAEADRKLGRYLFDLNSRFTLDGSPRWNTARYVNHSCKPNAEPVDYNGRIWIEALRVILPGEEITYDYGKEYFNEFITAKKCRCGNHKGRR